MIFGHSLITKLLNLLPEKNEILTKDYGKLEFDHYSREGSLGFYKYVYKCKECDMYFCFLDDAEIVDIEYQENHVCKYNTENCE